MLITLKVLSIGVSNKIEKFDIWTLFAMQYYISLTPLKKKQFL